MILGGTQEIVGACLVRMWSCCLQRLHVRSSTFGRRSAVAVTAHLPLQHHPRLKHTKLLRLKWIGKRIPTVTLLNHRRGFWCLREQMQRAHRGDAMKVSEPMRAVSIDFAVLLVDWLSGWKGEFRLALYRGGKCFLVKGGR